MGKDRHGANGADIVLKVPAGTQIYDEDGETLLADLTEAGQRVVLARGGNGGFGNAHFKTSTNRAPRHANPGPAGRGAHDPAAPQADRRCRHRRPAQCRASRRSSRRSARPSRRSRTIPSRRCIRSSAWWKSTGSEFVLADIPGLIEGAHEGGGLGDRFLGHVERCRVLLHLVDGTGEHAGEAYETVRAELEAYGQGLTDKPEIVALNKADAMTPRQLKQRVRARARRRARRPGRFGRDRRRRCRGAARAAWLRLRRHVPPARRRAGAGGMAALGGLSGGKHRE